MKFNFKIQDYQTDAVDAIVDCFEGQPFSEGNPYRRDIQDINQDISHSQISMDMVYDYANTELIAELSSVDFKNSNVQLSPEDLLKNIRNIQEKNGLKQSDTLVDALGACSLDIEMETGTGKTYVYIKTMYELNKTYGWSKFIVVVPSIAIREGVKKSFETMQDHFMEQYHKKIRSFIYDSKNLNQLDAFASDPGINVMIINMQAFNTTLKEGGKSKDARIIYSRRDEFSSRRPIDVIKANRPILILDEPQKMSGKATQKGLKNFNPLFTLNYSATHAKKHNLVYALDAIDAYNERLVKKIEVKGFQVQNLKGIDRYLYLEEINLTSNKPPRARLEFEVKQNNGIKRRTRILSVGDNLYKLSNEMEQYKGYIIAEIDPLAAKVTFTNGVTISTGELSGDDTKDTMRRIQIRETIASHLEKEEELFTKGIKTLSLFFIDEVSKYRKYDDNGDELLGEYGEIFEEEYTNLIQEYRDSSENQEYVQYLNSILVSETHNGYFSIDRNGKTINGNIKKTTGLSDDISAYDLILKNKERLLSFEEPTRFIFSHSALREGWDNPNVFQICTLKEGHSTTAKRQEVGRGLRLCVDKDGQRIDQQFLPKEQVHQINKLTVIASESYQSFVTDLQTEMKDNLYERPTEVTEDYFEGIVVKDNRGEEHQIIEKESKQIHRYLIRNEYIDDDDKITQKYKKDRQNDQLKPFEDKTLISISDGIHQHIQAVYDDSILPDMISNGNETKIKYNVLNKKFEEEDFQKLWKTINHQYTYTVSFDSDELIQNAIDEINENLYVSRLRYTTSVSEQKSDLTSHIIREGDSFETATTRTQEVSYSWNSSVRYDLIGKIAENTVLTRHTVVKILKGIDPDKFAMYHENPEEFISRVSQLIEDQKALIIVDHIRYKETKKIYDNSIFVDEIHSDFRKAISREKYIKDYLFVDGISDNSVEKKFSDALEAAEEVSVYAKLPKGFAIPTPVGNYSPDWAIAFKKNSVKHLFFIAETKGSTQNMQLRPIEQAKIECAERLFHQVSQDKGVDIVYHAVDTYETLLNIMPTI